MALLTRRLIPLLLIPLDMFLHWEAEDLGYPALYVRINPGSIPFDDNRTIQLAMEVPPPALLIVL